jgi:DNA-binding response OmpR family regulator
MHSVLRRSKESKSAKSVKHVLRFGPLEIDVASQVVKLAGESLQLTSSEFTALRLFAENVGQPVDRDKLSTALKGCEWDVFDRSIDNLVSRLRQKLGDDSRKPRLIKTVRGAGYMLVAIDEEYRTLK